MNPSQQPSLDTIAQLAPLGTLRAAINYGNPALAKKDRETGTLSGVSVDLANALAASLGVPLRLLEYSKASGVVEDARTNTWDVAFTGIDPERAKDMDYTAPYLLIEGVYMVREDSAIRSNEDVDRRGHRVAVSRGSAYDLFLTRTLRDAELVRGDDPTRVADMLGEQALDIVAGVKARSEMDAKRIGGLRLLDGNFMEIRQAMAIPKGRTRGAQFLDAFVEAMKASGFVGDALIKHRVDSGKVAPIAFR